MEYVLIGCCLTFFDFALKTQNGMHISGLQMPKVFACIIRDAYLSFDSCWSAGVQTKFPVFGGESERKNIWYCTIQMKMFPAFLFVCWIQWMHPVFKELPFYPFSKKFCAAISWMRASIPLNINCYNFIRQIALFSTSRSQIYWTKWEKNWINLIKCNWNANQKKEQCEE